MMPGNNEVMMTYCAGSARVALAAILAFAAAAASAQDRRVELNGINSALIITGDLISAEGGKFVVETAIGEFEIEQALVTCEGPGCPAPREIVYDLNLVGEGEIASMLIPVIAEGYAATLDAETRLLDSNGHPVDPEFVQANLGGDNKIGVAIIDFDGEEVANIGILGANGTAAYEKLVSGEAPIIFMDERATKKQRDLIADAGLGDLTDPAQDHVIAVEGYAVVVNPKNAVGALTLEQVSEVLAGNITDWSALGGAGGPISLYSRDPASDAFTAVSEILLEDRGYTLSPGANIVRNSGELTTAIMGDEAGFGVVNFHGRRDTRALPLKNDCGMTFYISPFSIKAEEYPLAHGVHAYSRLDVEGHGRAFLDFIAGPDLDGLIEKAGFVDLSIVSDIQVDAAERVVGAAAVEADPYVKGYMDTLVQKLAEYERLSTTFRFALASDEFDAKGVRDLQRLMTYLAERKPAEIVIVGFTDNKSSFDANLNVGLTRAEATLERVRAAAEAAGIADISMIAESYGELAPVACNSDPRGRAANRRVEIWIR